MSHGVGSLLVPRSLFVRSGVADFAVNVTPSGRVLDEERSRRRKRSGPGCLIVPSTYLQSSRGGVVGGCGCYPR